MGIEVTNKTLKELGQYEILIWLKAHEIKTEDGKVLDFDDHRFLVELFDDWSPKQVIKKAAQIGFSTLAILKTLWAIKHKGLNCIYTLPTASDVYEFVGGKINRLIAQNEVLKGYTKDRDTITQKQLGENLIYYRGTFMEKQAISISADWNVHDEEDRSDQRVISVYGSRLQHSKYKWEYHFSNPSVRGNGVDAYWQLSDQREWFVKCACGKEQYLTWPDSVDAVKGIFVCKHCGQEITDDQRRNGRWVARFKDREWRGYHISLLMAPWVSAKEILQYSKEKDPEYFYNFVLGEPYDSGDTKVSHETLVESIVTKPAIRNDRMVIGVDTGTTIYWTLGDKMGLRAYGSASDYSEIEILLKRFPKAIAVFDQGGDLIEPRKIQERFKGRVFLCYFIADRKTQSLIRWGHGEESGVVHVDRNRLIDLLHGELKDKRIPLYGTEQDWLEYMNHWDNIYAVYDEDEKTRHKRKIWKRKGPDHWVFSTIYWRVGIDKYGVPEGEVMGTNNSLPESPIITDGYMLASDMMRQDDKPEDWRDV